MSVPATRLQIRQCIRIIGNVWMSVFVRFCYNQFWLRNLSVFKNFLIYQKANWEIIPNLEIIESQFQDKFTNFGQSCKSIPFRRRLSLDVHIVEAKMGRLGYTDWCILAICLRVSDISQFRDNISQLSIFQLYQHTVVTTIAGLLVFGLVHSLGPWAWPLAKHQR